MPRFLKMPRVRTVYDCPTVRCVGAQIGLRAREEEVEVGVIDEGTGGEVGVEDRRDGRGGRPFFA